MGVKGGTFGRRWVLREGIERGGFGGRWVWREVDRWVNKSVIVCLFD